MKKTILQVFGIIGVLVLAFLVWQLVFNDGGIIKTGYNSMANLVNNQYAKVAGEGEALLPLWDAQGQADADTAGGVTYYGE